MSFDCIVDGTTQSSSKSVGGSLPYRQPTAAPPTPLAKGRTDSISSTGLPGRQYTQTRVLLVHWENEDLPCRAELIELGEFLSTKFGYTWQLCTLPREGYLEYLEQELRRFKTQLADDELLIVVYSGHGWREEKEVPQVLMWTARKSGTLSLEWNDMQNNILFPGGQDILLVLDCCAAKAACKSALKARIDVIAACAENETTDAPGPGSFTDFFTQALKSFDSAFTPGALVEKIEKIQELSPKKTIKKPHYHIETPDAGHEIYLVPLKSKGPPVKGRRDSLALNPVEPEVVEERPGVLQLSDPYSGIRNQVQIGPTNSNVLQNLLGQGVRAFQTISASAGSLALPGFQRRSAGFFTAGRVFIMAWGDPTLSSIEAPLTRSQPSTAKLRSFVVIRQSESSCIALPIVSYGGRGVAAPGVLKSNHGIIYREEDRPRLLRGEEPRRGELPMRKAVRCEFDEHSSKLDSASRIDYSSLYVVDYNLPVKSLGMIHRNDLQTLIRQLQAVWADIRTTAATAGSSQEQSSACPECHFCPGCDPLLGQDRQANRMCRHGRRMSPVVRGQAPHNCPRTNIGTTAIGSGKSPATSSRGAQPDSSLREQAVRAIERLMAQGLSREEATRRVQEHLTQARQVQAGTGASRHKTRDNESDSSPAEEEDDDESTSDEESE